MQQKCLLVASLLVSLMNLTWSLSFTTQRQKATSSIKKKQNGWVSFKHLSMKDRSAAYWFTVGDSVAVVGDVIKAGYNVKGRHGKVLDTWEKCDVDPTCCCAEWVDAGMSIRVEFHGTESDENGQGSFVHYFAEDELLKIQKESITQVGAFNLPFDGMSCKAFKLEQLAAQRNSVVQQISADGLDALGIVDQS